MAFKLYTEGRNARGLSEQSTTILPTTAGTYYRLMAQSAGAVEYTDCISAER